MKPKKYILRQPETVLAIMWNGENVNEVVKFMQHDSLDASFSMNSNTLKVGSMRVPLGDYIVYDPADGIFRRYTAEEFTDKYKLEQESYNDEFYDKEFKCNDSTLCRRDLESLTVPFNTENVSDEVMQKIIDDTDAGTRQTWKLRDDRPLFYPEEEDEADDGDDVSSEKISETWWKELEAAANRYNVPYYEDLETE